MQRWLRRLGHQQGGYVLVAVMLVSVVLFISAFAVLSHATGEAKRAGRDVNFERAWYAAMAGVEECIARVQWEYPRWALASASTGDVWCNMSGTVGANGDAYAGTAVVESPMVLRIEIQGTSGPITRNLEAIIEPELNTGSGDMSFITGGNIWFAGGPQTYIEGNLGAVGVLELRNQVEVCGHLRSRDQDPILGANVNLIPGDPCYSDSDQDPTLVFPMFDVDFFKRSEADIEADTGLDWTVTTVNGTAKAADIDLLQCASPIVVSPYCDGSTNPVIIYARTTGAGVGADVGHIKLGSNGGNVGVGPGGDVSCGSGSSGGNGKMYFKGNVYLIADGNVCISRDIEVVDDGTLHIYTNTGGIYITNATLEGVELVADDPARGNDPTIGRILTPGNAEIHGKVMGWYWINNGNIKLYSDTEQIGHNMNEYTPGLVSLWEP